MRSYDNRGSLEDEPPFISEVYDRTIIRASDIYSDAQRPLSNQKKKLP